MDPVWKHKWIKALRSGEYKQGKKRLRNNDEFFCCLGVLCDIYDSEQWEKRSFFGTDFFWEYKDNKSILPYSIQEQVGLDTDNTTELMRMNDNGVSFTGIANYIEENL